MLLISSTESQKQEELILLEEAIGQAMSFDLGQGIECIT